MEFQDCLEGELRRLTAIVDAVAPDIAAPRSWLSRILNVFSSLVI